MKSDHTRASVTVQKPSTDRSRGVAWSVAGPTTLLAIGLVGLLFYDTAASIVGVWHSSVTFSHGFAIVPIVIGLVWYRRRALAATTPRPWPWALLGLAAAGLAWLVGAAGSVDGIQHFALATMIPFTVWTLLGHQATRVLLFPLGYLFLAVPFGAFLIQPLMIVTADMTVSLVRASGIPVYREALEFSLPSGNWSVVEACSGIRYLIASVALGVLYAHLVYRSLLRRSLFVLASIVVPIVANGLRAYMIVMIGHVSGMEYAVGVDHLLYGWVFFGIVMFALFWVGSWWREDSRSHAPTNRQDTAAAPASAPAPTHGLPKLLVSACAVVLTAGTWPVYAGLAVNAPAAPVAALSAPESVGGWTEGAPPVDPWRPDYDDPRAEVVQYYADHAGAPVGLFVGYYQDQFRHAEMLAWGNDLAPSSGSGWRQVGRGGASAPGDGLAAPVEAVLRRGDERRLAWRWYWVDGQWTASRAEVKARVTLSRLLRQGDATAVVVVHAGYDHSATEVRDQLRAFSRSALPAIAPLLAAHADAGRSAAAEK